MEEFFGIDLKIILMVIVFFLIVKLVIGNMLMDDEEELFLVSCWELLKKKKKWCLKLFVIEMIEFLIEYKEEKWKEEEVKIVVV